ncbi:hypothetical protein PL9214290287 [Planktothrix tepida PCC 9214]|uniref:Uncharacterized protein n=1 Tax=Planktothrix tepida PCC 9214 TaxID=671072 RepID=A0A1J1LGJ4_9CYAN|nr:hypothetical protein PL9214290287 [Planktothrix tepida PCC 9214]
MTKGRPDLGIIKCVNNYVCVLISTYTKLFAYPISGFPFVLRASG